MNRKPVKTTSNRYLCPALLAPICGLLLLASCRTQPVEVPEDLKPLQYFQLAQETASKRQDYYNAIRIYQIFIERYPEDVQRVVEAEYEIAFLYYKSGDISTAETLFENLLARYEGTGAQVLPMWPAILSRQILQNMAEERERR